MYNKNIKTPIRYRGYYYDENTKLYYPNARYYFTEFRRFISPADASALNSNTVNGLNFYVYEDNNPIDIQYNGSSTSTPSNATVVVAGVVAGTILITVISDTLDNW